LKTTPSELRPKEAGELETVDHVAPLRPPSNISSEVTAT